MNVTFQNLYLQAWRNEIPPPQNTSVHPHRLLYTGTSVMLSENQNGVWTCAVCQNTSDTLNQTFSFHCLTCDDFDICRDCLEPKRHPSHIHELNLVNTSLVYGHKNGLWVCDICGNESRWHEKYVTILICFYTIYIVAPAFQMVSHWISLIFQVREIKKKTRSVSI